MKEASLLCPDVINTALILLTETFCQQASHFTFHLRVRKLCVFATPRVSAAFCKAPYSGEDTPDPEADTFRFSVYSASLDSRFLL